MIGPKIHGVRTVASSYQLSPRVVSPAVYTPLRHSNNYKKLCIKSQGNVSPIPNGNLGNQQHLLNVVGPSATKTMPIMVAPPDEKDFEQKSGDGIGIVDFLTRKNYFVTGSTGLLAKVFMEKVLRMSPIFGKIYVLIRAKDEEAAVHRLKKEVIDSEVFQHQRQQYGHNYEGFMLSKIIPVVGDIGEPNLGIQCPEAMNRIIDEVDVFVNSAANTVLDERRIFALALARTCTPSHPSRSVNTFATLQALDLAKKCKNLRIFLHVSTAYVNGTRQGLLPEKHFEMGQSIAAEKSISNGRPLLPPLDVYEEMRFATYTVDAVPQSEVAQKMKVVGMARATLFGWQNTYQFTKAMAEMVIHESRCEVPVIIVRPSVIESTFQEPFPGWIQGNRVLEPVIISYAKGRLSGALADPEVVLDIVPLDVVVNTMVATMAKHGKSSDSGLFVYHATSSTVNPCTLYDLFRSFYLHFAAAPMTDTMGSDIRVDEVKFFGSMDEYQTHVERDILQKFMTENRLSDPNAKLVNGLERKFKRVMENITHLGKLYQPYFFNRVRFDNSNTDKLIKEMSSEEKLGFPMDMRGINWEDYFVNIHIPGVRKHVMKKPLTSHERS